MSTIADMPKTPFRLSQLIHDTRYRSLTIQTVAMILLMALGTWLLLNVSENLERGGKSFDFGFLSRPAGYDISQTLIPYDSVTSTHARAAMVGMVNTMLVAAMGCVLATIIGVLVGVLRLSKNVLVSRLMGIYVNGFRNVPLLIWIIGIYAVVTESLPAPNAFRTGDAAMLLGDSVAITNRYAAIPAPVVSPLGWVVIAIFAASILGVVVLRRIARARQEATGEQLPVLWIALAILILPATIAYFILGRPIALEYPVLRGFNFAGGIRISAPLVALWLALSLYTAAFIAEIVRGGILAISRGQSEAASALGLRPNRTMSLIILPQALRVIIPPMISQYLNLTKNSSLALAVGYADAKATLGGTTINLTGKELEGTLLLGIFYLVVSLVISAVLNVVNRRSQLSER